MRRLLPLALLLSFVALAGCGGSDDEAGQTTAATTAASGEKQIRVGLITDQGQFDDNGFNELAFNGLTRAEKELGIKGRVVESASAADYIPNMSRLARDGYDLVIGVGFAQGDAVGKVAQKFPNVGFAIIDVDHAFVPGKPANVQGLLFREQEVGYLVGYLAGLEEKRRAGADAISAVGGMKEPPVDRFVAGYFAGAAKADPGIKTMLDYSQDWDDQAKCKELALNQIARGGLPDDQGRAGRDLEGRRQRDLRTQGGRRRARQGEPEGAAGRYRQGRGDQGGDRVREDHRHPDDGRQELDRTRPFEARRGLTPDMT